MMNKLKSIKTSFLAMLMFLSVSLAMGQELMPITKIDKQTSRKGEIVWVDLVTNDGKASKKFFSELLDWNFKDHGSYQMALSGTKPVAGIIEDKELLKGSNSSYWVVSASVKDVNETSKKVVAKGGKILSEPLEISGRGNVALVQDKQGAFFSIMQNKSGDPKASAPRNGEWMWAELWTNDTKAAVGFYTDVLSVTAKPYSDNDTEAYYILKGTTYEFAGITESPLKEENSIWLPVLRVKDSETIAKRVLDLGGSILINPIEVSGNKVALVATPSGAPFLLQEWKD